jgi:hypothetical protein
MSVTLPDPRINIDFDFIAELEGGSLTKGYVPDPENSQSGVTIAVGFDLGARDLRDLQRLGLSESLIEILKPYLGYKGVEALRFLQRNPLKITQSQADAINQVVKYKMAKDAIEQYNKTSAVDFSVVPPRWQTVIVSVSFQYGSLKRKCPMFFKCVTNQDWDAALAELEDFGDSYATRRRREANYARGH